MNAFRRIVVCSLLASMLVLSLCSGADAMKMNVHNHSDQKITVVVVTLNSAAAVFEVLVPFGKKVADWSLDLVPLMASLVDAAEGKGHSKHIKATSDFVQYVREKGADSVFFVWTYHRLREIAQTQKETQGWNKYYPVVVEVEPGKEHSYDDVTGVVKVVFVLTADKKSIGVYQKLDAVNKGTEDHISAFHYNLHVFQKGHNPGELSKADREAYDANHAKWTSKYTGMLHKVSSKEYLEFPLYEKPEDEDHGKEAVKAQAGYVGIAVYLNELISNIVEAHKKVRETLK